MPSRTPTTNLNLKNKRGLINKKDPKADLGIEHSHLEDPSNSFKYHKAPCEKIFEGHDNTCIVFGRDRPGDLQSGYGSKGHLKSGAIDIVVGRLSAQNASDFIGQAVSPNYGADAARVVLSQKTDVDINFQIPLAKTGLAMAQSAVGIKADAVRVIGRQSLKLVTNTDQKMATNTDREAYSGVGVELICASAPAQEADMQPIPKGKNLVAVLEELHKHLMQVNTIIRDFYTAQTKFNDAISKHTHYYIPPSGTPEQTSTDPYSLVEWLNQCIELFNKVDTGLGTNVYNLTSWKNNLPTINSKFHFLN